MEPEIRYSTLEGCIVAGLVEMLRQPLEMITFQG